MFTNFPVFSTRVALLSIVSGVSLVSAISCSSGIVSGDTASQTTQDTLRDIPQWCETRYPADALTDMPEYSAYDYFSRSSGAVLIYHKCNGIPVFIMMFSEELAPDFRYDAMNPEIGIRLVKSGETISDYQIVPMSPETGRFFLITGNAADRIISWLESGGNLKINIGNYNVSVPSNTLLK